MRVFVTGATGFIGSAIVQELMNTGHHVLGLARNDAAADALARLGVEAHRGDLSDTESLAAGASTCEGVIHTAYNHDFSDMAAAAETDIRAVKALGATLAGSGRPLVIASGTATLAPGRVATEEDTGDFNRARRLASEIAMMEMASQGVRSSVVRLSPTVHGKGDHGFVPRLIAIAREKGVSAYVRDGHNRWPAVHRLDAARLFRLALEKGAAGSRFHGVAEEGVPTRAIAEAIGRHLNVPIISKSPEEAADHFGFLGVFFGLDCPASSTQTQEQLDWHPTQPGLIADLDMGHYFEI